MHDYEYEYEYEHDLDRTQREFESALQELQPEYFEIPGEEEFFGETETASTQHEADSYRASFQHPSQEAQELELELAAELLEVTSEEELDRFFGDVFKKVGGFVSNAAKSPVFKALGGVLKPIAKSVLPMAGKALGSYIGGPAGDVIGSNLASAAGSLFGLELEGLSGEDREFEMAKGFVRLASGAAEEVKKMHYRPGHDPHHAAKTAVMRASRRHLGAEPGATTENIDITIDTARPRPQAPAQQTPRPQAPGLQAPRPQAPGPHATADGSSHPGPTSGRTGGVYPGAPIPEPSSFGTYGAPPVSQGDWPPESIPAGAKRHGTWFRRGRRIILIGV